MTLRPRKCARSNTHRLVRWSIKSSWNRCRTVSISSLCTNYPHFLSIWSKWRFETVSYWPRSIKRSDLKTSNTRTMIVLTVISMRRRTILRSHMTRYIMNLTFCASVASNAVTIKRWRFSSVSRRSKRRPSDGHFARIKEASLPLYNVTNIVRTRSHSTW